MRNEDRGLARALQHAPARIRSWATGHRKIAALRAAG